MHNDLPPLPASAFDKMVWRLREMGHTIQQLADGSVLSECPCCQKPGDRPLRLHLELETVAQARRLN